MIKGKMIDVDEIKMIKDVDELKCYMKSLVKLGKKGIKKVKKVSGYNVYCGENRGMLCGKPSEVMGELGKGWRSISIEKRTEYNERALSMNEMSCMKFVCDEENEFLVEFKSQIRELMLKFKRDIKIGKYEKCKKVIEEVEEV